MSQAQGADVSKATLLRDLKRANDNLEYNEKARRFLLQGLAQGKLTKDGENQHGKLETVEAAIAGCLSVKHNIEAILADLYG
jgi:hypothetical protein